jgi:N utilization substance protein B
MPIRAETRSRALALQLLYAWDVGGGTEPQRRGGDTLWGRVVALAGARPRVEDRALALAGAVVERRADVDGRIAAAAERWRLERLGAVDRNILRLASAELLEGVTPPRVVIDEAVRLAHWFGGPRSPGFVNGVLDRIARDLGRL